LSLWDQVGSQVIRGNLLVIPIEESLIYVQAIYLRAEGGRIPELKRVVVAYQNRVVMEETFDRGLARLFGGATESDRAPPAARIAAAAAAGDTAPATGRVAELIRQADAAYQRAIAAQRAGDWATYGEAIRQVGELLRELRAGAGSVAPWLESGSRFLSRCDVHTSHGQELQLYLDDDVHLRLRALAANQGRTISDLVREAVGARTAGRQKRIDTLRGITRYGRTETTWRHRRVREAAAPEHASAPETGLVGVLYDSDVIIEILRGRPNTVKAATALEAGGVPSYCTAVAWAEVYAGIRPGEEPLTQAFFEARGEIVLDGVVGRRAGAYLARYARSPAVELADALVAAAATSGCGSGPSTGSIPCRT
jgi:predicted nucleic acid-binding protein